MLTTTSHDSVLLRADDSPDRHELHHQFPPGMTDKWFHKLISEGHFLLGSGTKTDYFCLCEKSR